MAACSEVLKVNRDLLDSQFDGYKLSLDALPTYQLPVGSGIDEVKLRDDEYTFQHMQAFGLTNYLFGDLWNPGCVYYVDTEWNVLQQRVVLESQLNENRVVFTIPDALTRRVGSRHCVSLHFPSPQLCVLSDGVGLLYLLDTGNRDVAELEEWKVAFKQEVCGGVPAILLHASLTGSAVGSEVKVDCVLLHIEKSSPGENGEPAKSSSGSTNQSDHVTYLEWVTLKRTSDEAEFELENTRKLRGKTAPIYCGVEEGAQGLYVASEADFEVISDSLNPLPTKMEEKEEKQEEATPPPLFTWTQTGDDVTITFIVPETVTKPDVQIVMETDRIDVKIRGGKELLSGALFRLIDISCCTWTLEKRKLEVTLAKEDEGFMWTEVVVGHSGGEYVADPDQARMIHERLAHLTADAMDPDPSGDIGGQAGVSPQDLEECDMNVENEVCIYRIDGQKHNITHKASLASHQRLFKAPLQPHLPPSFCLRHDVDGIVWQPKKTDEHSPSPWQHKATFNALGYVQASKRNCKFAGCAPDVSYCVLCDCTKHAYIYRQPSEIASPIRNRKSGRVIGQIAKQQVVSLDSSEDILGMQTTNERLFILTSSKLYIIRVKID